MSPQGTKGYARLQGSVSVWLPPSQYTETVIDCRASAISSGFLPWYSAKSVSVVSSMPQVWEKPEIKSLLESSFCAAFSTVVTGIGSLSKVVIWLAMNGAASGFSVSWNQTSRNSSCVVLLIETVSSSRRSVVPVGTRASLSKYCPGSSVISGSLTEMENGCFISVYEGEDIRGDTTSAKMIRRKIPVMIPNRIGKRLISSPQTQLPRQIEKHETILNSLICLILQPGITIIAVGSDTSMGWAIQAVVNYDVKAGYFCILSIK